MHIAWFEYFQILSLMTAIYCWKDLQSCSLIAFIPLLIIVNATELIADNYQSFGWSSNYRIYNIYLLLSTPLFFYLAGKMLFLTRRESIVYVIVCVLSLILMGINYAFVQGPIVFNSYSLGLADMMIIVFSGFCLVRLTVFDQQELNFMREPYFWINSLNLLSGLVTLVILGLQSYILMNKIEIANKTLYHAILPAVNAIVYGGYSYAFILCRTKRARSSSLS